jgi:hypothetical protein
MAAWVFEKVHPERCTMKHRTDSFILFEGTATTFSKHHAYNTSTTTQTIGL